MNNIFNRSERNSKNRNSVFRDTPQRNFNSNYGSRSFSQTLSRPENLKGTFSKKFSPEYLKNYQYQNNPNKVNSIIFMDEYEGSSLIEKRIQDYEIILKKEAPNNPDFEYFFNNALRSHHLGIAVKIYGEDNLNSNNHLSKSNFFYKSNNQNMYGNRNESFFSSNRDSGRNNNFFSRNDNSPRNSSLSTNGNSQRTSFFGNTNRNQEDYNSKPSSFFNSSQNRETPKFNDPANDRRTGSNFFSNRNNSQNENSRTSFFSNRNEAQNNTNSGSGFFGNRTGNSTNENRSSFFSSNRDDNNNTKTSFFGRNETNNFTNKSPQDNSNITSFFNRTNNSNNNPSSFFNNNNNQNQNPPSSFFGNSSRNNNNDNNSSGNNSFFRNNNIPNTYNQNNRNGFFNNNENTNGFFTNQSNNNSQSQSQGMNYYPGNNNMGMNPMMGNQPYYQPQMFIQPNPYIYPQNPIYSPYVNYPLNQIIKPQNTNLTNLLEEKDLKEKIDIINKEIMKEELNKIDQNFMLTQKMLKELKKNDDEEEIFDKMFYRKRKMIDFAKKNLKEKLLRDNNEKNKKGNIFTTFLSNNKNENGKDEASTYHTNKSAKNNNMISLNIVVNFLNEEIKMNCVEINKLQTIKNLKHYVINKMSHFNYTEKEIIKNSHILFNKTIYPNDMRLRDIEDIDVKDVVLQVDLNVHKNSEKSLSEKEESEYLCPEGLLPVLTKVGYHTKPTINRLTRMRRDELENVKGFKIWNDHGEIEWDDACDLVYQNLDEDVIIRPGEVDVYPDDLYMKMKRKPEIGTKLNKPCVITLYDIKPKSNEKLSNFILKLEKICEKQSAEFLDYDEKNYFWKFRVFHFTKYCFLDVDLEDEDNQANQSFENEEVEEEEEEFGKTISNSNLNKKSESFSKMEVESFKQKEIQNDESDINRSFIKKSPRKNSELLDLLNKSQNLSFFKNSKNETKKDISISNKIKSSKRKNIDLHQEIFFNPTEKIPEINKREEEEIALKIKNLETAYERYSIAEADFTTNKKKLKYNEIDTKVLESFSYLNKIINNDVITEESKYFYKNFDFPLQWKDNNTLCSLNKNCANNVLEEKSDVVNKNLNLTFNDSINKVFTEILRFQKSKKELSVEEFLDVFFINSLNQFEKQDLNNENLFLMLIKSFFNKNCFSFSKTKSYGIDIEKQLEILKNEKQSKITKSTEDYFFYRSISLWIEKAMFLTVKIEKSTSLNSQLFDHILSNKKVNILDGKVYENFEYLEFKNLKKKNILKKILTDLEENKITDIFKDIYEIIKDINEEELDFAERIFVDAIKIKFLVESKNFEKIDSYIIGSKIIKQNQNLTFLNLLFLNILLIECPEIEKIQKFIKNYKWIFKTSHEVLIENKSYFLSLLICRYFIKNTLLDKNGYEQHTLHQIMYYSDLNKNQINKILEDFVHVKDLPIYKSIYSLIKEKFSDAMEEIFPTKGGEERAYDIFFNNFLLDFIINKNFEDYHIDQVFHFYEKFSRFSNVELTSLDKLIYDFFKFLDLNSKLILFERSHDLKQILECIFGNIQKCYEDKTFWSNYEEIIKIISSHILKVVANKNINDISSEVKLYLQKDFIEFINQNKILILFKEEDKNEIVEGFLFLL